MTLPNYLQPVLASYDVSKLDSEKDKDIIVTEILNKGDENSLAWLTNTYSKGEIKQVISSPIKGMWLKRTLEYWLKIFDVKIDEKSFENSIINLNA